MDRHPAAVEYRQNLDAQLIDLLTDLRPADLTLPELQYLVELLRCARDRVTPVCRQ